MKYIYSSAYALKKEDREEKVHGEWHRAKIEQGSGHQGIPFPYSAS